jgi:hypothetical protein
MVDPKHDVNEIRVTDLRGLTVLTVAGNSSGRHELRSTSLSAGLYTLNLVLTDGSTTVGRLVKE